MLLTDPIVNHYTEASGDRAQFGWPFDEEIEKLRMEFARESDPKKQFALAEQSRSACSTSASPCRSASTSSRWPGARP